MSPTQRRRSHPLTVTTMASLAALIGLLLAVVSIPLAVAVDLIRSRGGSR